MKDAACIAVDDAGMAASALRAMTQALGVNPLSGRREKPDRAPPFDLANRFGARS
jgi:hypothetical protein